MSLEHYKYLIRGLGDKIEVKDLAPDEEHYLCLSFDENVVIHFQYHPELSQVMLFSVVGTLKGREELDKYFKDLLQANLYWQETAGATLGIDGETDEILITHKKDIYNLNEDHFYRFIETFVNISEHWQKRLA